MFSQGFPGVKGWVFAGAWEASKEKDHAYRGIFWFSGFVPAVGAGW